MTRSLKDKVAVVTGSTSGIGKGIALHFAQLGAKVVVSGRDLQRGCEAAERIKIAAQDAGGDAEFYEADLTVENQCRQLIGFCKTHFGRVDILVNNAADTSRGNVEDTPVDLWNRIMLINLRAPFICIQEAVKYMKEQGGGAIVNIGSVNAYIGEPKLFAYSVSKGGLMTLTKNAASYLNQHRIRVNQINVGWTVTEGEHRVKRLEGKGEEWLEEAVATRPFGRLLYPEDVARAAAFFASRDGECITGSVMDFEQYPVGAPPNW